ARKLQAARRGKQTFCGPSAFPGTSAAPLALPRAVPAPPRESGPAARREHWHGRRRAAGAVGRAAPGGPVRHGRRFTLALTRGRRATVRVAVKCRNRRGERGRRGRERLVYALWGLNPRSVE